ncbi:hypothetical protein LTR05_007993 [Lithohypha guttulata]|uniref:Uncharacterized protein n=1 Tax=Lithohypha guttulata TaxID=1690604 RepID=A0AAN7YD32_9EURO|nr:hypothetical protein LTR05_007993 [Lithohypha guttulata]
MTIIGFLLLKVVTIASTGLFFPAIVTVGPIEQYVLQTSQFDLVTNFSDYSDPGASPFYQAYAVMQLGLPLPLGLTRELLYETHKPEKDKVNANATYLVPGRAFSPQVNCQAVSVNPLIDWDSFGSTVEQEAELRVQNTSRWMCPARTGSASDELNLHFTDVASRLAPARQILSSFGALGCTSDDMSNDSGTAPYLVALSDIRYKQTFNVSTTGIAVGDMIDPVSWEFAIPKITGMLCTIDYEMLDVSILYNMSLVDNPVQSVDVLRPSAPPKLANLPNTYLSRKLAYAAPTSSGGARDMFGLFTQFEDVEQPPHTVLTMIANRLGADFEYLLDHPREFEGAAQYVMNSMLLQIAKEAILISDSNSTFQPQQVLGQERHNEERLIVQTIPLLINVAGITILILITGAILMVRPRSSTSDNPESLTYKADVVKASGKLNEMLEQLADVSETSSRPLLRRTMYQNDVANTSIIVYSSPNNLNSNGLNHVRPTRTSNGYTPLTLSKAYIVVTLLSATVAIAALEILQHYSDTGVPGLARIHTIDSFVISVYSRFLPALIALLIATMFNCLDFNTAMLAPYNHLASNAGSYEEFRTPILAHIAPLAIMTALRRRYWAASLTGIGALIGSVLTIVVSGLYTVELIPTTSEVSITQLGSWNLSYVQGFQTDNAATAVSSLIESVTLAYPQFTHDGLAFPTLNDITGSDGIVTVDVPALRAELVCEELPWEMSNASIVWQYYKSTGYTAINFNVTVPLPDSCHYGSCFGNESTIQPYLTATTPAETTNTSYYAQAIDLHTGPWRANEEDCYIFFEPSGNVNADQPINQPGCPSMLLAYGYFDGNDHSKSTWTSMLCEQRVQQVDTSLTLTLPDKEIPLSSPPIPIESTAIYLGNGDNGEQNFGWWLSPSMEYSYVVFNESAIDPILLEGETSVSNDSPDFSNFFRGAFFGRTPLPLETLQRNDTASRALIFDHIQMFYRRYMAQYISANMRVLGDTTGTQSRKRDDRIVNSSSITGSFTPDTGVPRLVQHRTPKTIIQAMLAFMLVSAVLALRLGRFHGLVLWNPCTIAGVMVLFAGSKMCQHSEAIASMESKMAPERSDKVYRDIDDQGIDVSPREIHEMLVVPDRYSTRLGHATGLPTASIGKAEACLQGRLVPAMSSGRDWKDKSARFRLGWWRDSVFIGSKRNADAESEVGKWR